MGFSGVWVTVWIGVIVNLSWIGKSSYVVNSDDIVEFYEKYGDFTPSGTTTTSSLFTNGLKALNGWLDTTDYRQKAADNTDGSRFPYFKWFPLWTGVNTMPSGEDSSQDFTPLHCFNRGSVWSEYSGTNEITIHVELHDKTSLLCTTVLAFGTVQSLVLEVFEFTGKHKITYSLMPNATEAQAFDITNKGIRVFSFLDDPVHLAMDLADTAGLFVSALTKGVEQGCAKRNVEFLQEYADVKMEKRQTPNVDIDPTLIQSGDFIGVIRLDGIDTMLAWAMGSHTGHTTIAMWEDDELYIVESTSNTSYWQHNGIQRTPFHQWVSEARAANYQATWAPLSDEARSKFNATAAWEFFHSVDGYDYGWETMIFCWIDTLTKNYPCFPDDPSLCVEWEVFEVLLAIVEKLFPSAAKIVSPALNKRVGTDGLTLPEIYQKAYQMGTTSNELTTMVEQDDWKYDFIANDGKPVSGEAMVCSMFVCHMYKSGGLFDDLSGGRDSINCNEFTNFDVYGLDLFDGNVSNSRPQACKDADPNNPMCQLMGEYSLVLANFNTIKLHSHMAETCPGQAINNYERPPDC